MRKFLLTGLLVISISITGNGCCHPDIGSNLQSYLRDDAASYVQEGSPDHASDTPTSLTLSVGDVFRGNVAFADPLLNTAELSLFIVDISQTDDADHYEYDIEAIAVLDTFSRHSIYGYRGKYDAHHQILSLSNSNDIQPYTSLAADEYTGSILFAPLRLAGQIDENGQAIHFRLAGIGDTTLRRVGEALTLDKAIEAAVMYIKAYEEELP